MLGNNDQLKPNMLIRNKDGRNNEKIVEIKVK